MDTGTRKRRGVPAEELLKSKRQVCSLTYSGKTVRVTAVDNQKWIVFADVCKVLGYKNPNHEIKYVEHRDRLKVEIGLKNTLANCINKHGLLTVVALSGKKSAIPFLDWAMEEVFSSMATGR